MKRVTRNLMIGYFSFVIVKSILSYFIPAPSAFSDNYFYLKMAQSFFYDFRFSVHGIATHNFPPLYPILISLSYLFNDMRIVYVVVKLINSIMSSLIIFPSYLLAKEFLTKKRAFLIAILVSLLPSNFSFSPYIMSENLFYPLFMFAIYFIYKSYNEGKLVWILLAGIFIGLTSLTRNIGIIFLAILSLILGIKLIRKEYMFKRTALLILLFFITMLPWLIRNGLLFGFNLQGILGRDVAATIDASSSVQITNSVMPFTAWFIVYMGFLVLTSGIVPFTSSLMLSKEKLKQKGYFNLTLISAASLFSVVALASYYTSVGAGVYYKTLIPYLVYRPIGRYIDVILPVILINGFIGLSMLKASRKLFVKLLTITFAIVLFSSQLIFFPLFPINNLSLSWMGSLKFVYEYLMYGKQSFDTVFSISSLIFFMIIFTLIFVGIYILYKKNKLTFRNLAYFFAAFLLSTSLLNYGINYYNSKIFWFEGEQMQLALWLNDFDKNRISNILFDERDCTKSITKQDQSTLCEPSGLSTIMGIWLNDNIRVGDVSRLEGVDFVISKQALDLKLVKKGPSINIYKAY